MKSQLNIAILAALSFPAFACPSLVVAQSVPATPGAPAMQITPPPPTGQPHLVSAPTPGSSAVAVPLITESVVLSSPVPTVSPTWGYRTAVMGDRIFATGPERAVAAGECGQICMWERSAGVWKANPNLTQLERVTNAAFVLQRLQSGGGQIFTAVDRRDVGTTIRVLEPRDGRVVEVSSLMLPPDADLPTFGSAFSVDASTLAVSSTDLRFNLGDATEKRNRDPKVFIFSRHDSVWSLDGFVKAPATAVGATTDAMWFGNALSVSGDVLAIGSPSTLPVRGTEVMPVSGTSRVMIYRRMTGQWMPEVEISGSSVTPANCFGMEVAVEGDLLAVRGVDSNRAEQPGRVWLFTRKEGKWSFKQELLPAAGITPGRGYGFALRISKGHILIGDATARGADEVDDVSPGMVLVFEERSGTWQNTQRLMPKAPCAPRNFGNDVAADWPLVTVGRPKNERLNLEPGGVYVFDFSTQP